MTAERDSVSQEDILCPGRVREDEQKHVRPQRDRTSGRVHKGLDLAIV